VQLAGTQGWISFSASVPSTSVPDETSLRNQRQIAALLVSIIDDFLASGQIAQA
jgi:hypothetical protein